MTRSLLLPVALVALLLLLPAAAAQASRSTLTLHVDAPKDALTPDAPILTARATATLTGDPLTYQNLLGVPVTYTVTKQPDWAIVVITPSSDLFPMPATPGVSYHATRAFTVLVLLPPNATGEAVGEVEITATTMPSTLSAPALGKVSFTVEMDAPACDAGTVAAQSATVTPVGSWAPAGTAAFVAGLVASAAVGRRQKR